MYIYIVNTKLFHFWQMCYNIHVFKGKSQQATVVFTYKFCLI